MTSLTITAKGQITLRKDILRTLGVVAGDKVDVQVTPDGRVILSRIRKPGSIDDFIDVLHDRVNRPLSIDEMNEVVAQSWASQ